ncbi:MAG: hypothetical protein ABR902_01410 [Candidatus Korobacteraceae bacterium]|jgi:hypothetical protein
MQEGDLIRVIRNPDAVQDSEEFKTRSTLELCVGRVFPIMGFNEGFILIDVGEVVGRPSHMESIWIEPDCVEVVKE